ncbi:MAG: class I SAM-dependent methyltransferase [Bdellovibrionaceae bacterium]|nr:class I SAM-dependent methyltransferase [Pseudobdellovibrionaceae bacterium]
MSRVRKKVSKKNQDKSFDKYALYRRAVQSPETDVVFLRKVYRDLRKKDPRVMREDFCGTFALSCEWVKLAPHHEALGVDLDPEPLEYGRANYLSQLKEGQQKRVHLYEANVLKAALPPADITIAMNFSYFIFKTRAAMRAYFAAAYKSIKADGVFIADLFGGSLCYDENEEKTQHSGFAYYWDQAGFDPVTNEAQFHIHFKPKGQKKHERVFSYDWRMWSIPELREIMAEVGFKKTHVYWEGTNKSGGGNGVFTRTEKGESCQSWIAYIAAEK